MPDAAGTATMLVLPRLLAALDMLRTVGRHFHPPALGQIVSILREPTTMLRQAPIDAADPSIQSAAHLALKACDGLLGAPDADNPFLTASRAMRYISRAREALLAVEHVPMVSRHLLPRELRDNAATMNRLTMPPHPASGIFHFANQTTERGGYSVYVPSWYDAAQAWPVVVALHGGSGHGRLFITNWIPEARGHGLIVVCPTAVGETWSLMDPAVDADNLAAILAEVRARWSVDSTRMLLTGMSDGGTFTLLTGVNVDCPCTHLAPIAATFHPLLLAMGDPDRLAGLPIYMVHGTLDWMFRVSIARSAADALQSVGAAVVYREVADLSHTYPIDEQSGILNWFLPARSLNFAS